MNFAAAVRSCGLQWLSVITCCSNDMAATTWHHLWPFLKNCSTNVMFMRAVAQETATCTPGVGRGAPARSVASTSDSMKAPCSVAGESFDHKWDFCMIFQLIWHSPHQNANQLRPFPHQSAPAEITILGADQACPHPLSNYLCGLGAG